MKSTTIIFTLIATVALVGLFIFGYTKESATNETLVVQNASTTSTSGLLTVSETLYDFGRIAMKDGDVHKDFIIINATDRVITIATVLTSCMCTEAFIVRSDGSTKGPFGMAGMGHVPPANETISAGESRTIRVVYDPNAHGPAGVGEIDRLVTLTDTEGNTLNLEIKALVTP